MKPFVQENHPESTLLKIEKGRCVVIKAVMGQVLDPFI